jgi:hypothetical protein
MRRDAAGSVVRVGARLNDAVDIAPDAAAQRAYPPKE